MIWPAGTRPPLPMTTGGGSGLDMLSRVMVGLPISVVVSALVSLPRNSGTVPGLGWPPPPAAPAGGALLVKSNDTATTEIGKRRVGKESRSRWSPYHDTATTEIYNLSLHDALPMLNFELRCT